MIPEGGSREWDHPFDQISQSGFIDPNYFVMNFLKTAPVLVFLS